MNGLINDLQSESITPDDQNLLPRKSITSGHLIDNQENTSAPVMIDSSSNNPSQGPIRSMSESILIDHHDTSELPSTLPVQQDENSTDEDDFDGIQTNNIKQNSSDAKARVESSSSKRSVCRKIFI
jgi:nanoRNase/pAp phosphatase (c-di-AMP/oligoRNAs hydrolase)